MFRAEPLVKIRLHVLASEAADAALVLAHFGVYSPAQHAPEELSENPAEAYREAEEKIGGIVASLQAPAPPSSPKKSFSPSRLLPNLSREEFMKGVERAKEYIRAGDVFQVVLSSVRKLRRD